MKLPNGEFAIIDEDRFPMTGPRGSFTIVSVWMIRTAGEAFEVEFIRHLSGRHPLVATVRADDLLKLKGYKHVPAELPA